MEKTIKRILIEDVGTSDVIPKTQLEAIVDGNRVMLEPLEIESAHDIQSRLDTCRHDDRHNLQLVRTEGIPEDETYFLGCDYCHYSLELQRAEKHFHRYHEVE